MISEADSCGCCVAAMVVPASRVVVRRAGIFDKHAILVDAAPCTLRAPQQSAFGMFTVQIGVFGP